MGETLPSTFTVLYLIYNTTTNHNDHMYINASSQRIYKKLAVDTTQ